MILGYLASQSRKRFVRAGFPSFYFGDPQALTAVSTMADEKSDIPASTPVGDVTSAGCHDGVNTNKTHANVVEHARSAAAKEHSMTLLQGIKLYPKAIGWSLFISTCIVMEGYDISLVNNFCMSSLSSPGISLT